MTTKEKLVWRLGKLPSPDEVRELVKDKIITNEEAREILFSTETEDERDEKSLKSEIKFLREVIEKLSDRKQIVNVVKEVEIRYIKQPWFQPYYYYVNNGSGGSMAYYGASGTGGTAGGTNLLAQNLSHTGAVAGGASLQSSLTSNAVNCAFSSIKTF